MTPQAAELETLRKQCEALKNENKELSKRLLSYSQSNSSQSERETIIDKSDAFDGYVAELEKRYEGRLAAMREALEKVATFDRMIAFELSDEGQSLWDQIMVHVGAATQPHSGQRYLSPEQVLPLVQALRWAWDECHITGNYGCIPKALDHAKSLGFDT